MFALFLSLVFAACIASFFFGLALGIKRTDDYWENWSQMLEARYGLLRALDSLEHDLRSYISQAKSTNEKKSKS